MTDSETSAAAATAAIRDTAAAAAAIRDRTADPDGGADQDSNLGKAAPSFKSLWSWWWAVCNQTTTTMGDEQSTTTWDLLRSKKKAEVEATQELKDLLLAQYVQYSPEGFTGRASRAAKPQKATQDLEQPTPAGGRRTCRAKTWDWESSVHCDSNAD